MRPNRQRGVALVMTLIFLSVITVLAVAVLSMSRVGRVNVAESANRTIAEQMADMALERVKGEILEVILSPDPYVQEIMGPQLFVSTNYVDTANAFSNFVTAADWDQIAELGILPDPRPPVFVNTNRAGGSGPLDFRFYLDLNQNGRFDSNGVVRVVDETGTQIRDENGNLVYSLEVGDPEWIGVLQEPGEAHSRYNHLMGRYAFIAIPAGRTLDLNYAHNDAKRLFFNGFYRTQGVGPWEINLAAFLTDLNTNYWRNYDYNTDYSQQSGGEGMRDAGELVNHRQEGYITNLLSFDRLFTNILAADYSDDLIDGYSDSPASSSGLGLIDEMNDPDDVSIAWPGAPVRTNFYSIDEFFSPPAAYNYNAFSNALKRASMDRSTYNRYTFYKMLNLLATDSAPERERKIHLNYLNVPAGPLVAQRFDGAVPIPHDPTNGLLWTGTEFFNVVANELLRRELATNTLMRQQFEVAGLPLNEIFGMGVTNIPVFRNGSTRLSNSFVNLPLYHPRIHQLLQLTANLYDATRRPPVDQALPYFPTVFRPVFFKDAQGNISVVRYEEYDAQRLHDVLSGPMPQRSWRSLRHPIEHGALGAGVLPDTIFFYEVPLIVGAKKGFPNFNEFFIASDISITRKLEMAKPRPDAAPTMTNQMFMVGISNTMAIEAWYSYSDDTSTTNIYPRDLEMWAYLTNRTVLSKGFGPTNVNEFETNYGFAMIPASGGGWGGLGMAQYRIPGLTMTVPLPPSAYSQVNGTFQQVGPTNIFESLQDYDTNHWVLQTTNRVLYFVFDRDSTGRRFLVDAVSLSGLDSYFDISEELNRPDPNYNPLDNMWDGVLRRNSAKVTEGLYNQIIVSLDVGQSYAGSDWNSYAPGNLPIGETKLKAIDAFRYFVDPTGSIYPLNYFSSTNELPPIGTRMQVPFTPSKRMIHRSSWQVNDPLVHYTIGDVTDTNYINQYLLVTPGQSINIMNQFNLAKQNDTYSPWGGRNGATFPDNLTIKDPGMTNSIGWNFPEQKFPNIGWIGRVHRGTPWQTVYLKSAAADAGTWMNPEKPGMDLSTHPTNDWRLAELFTVALTPEMTRGRLSINQTNVAAWSALLSATRVTTLTENGGQIFAEEIEIEPAAVTDSPLVNIVTNVAGVRLQTPSVEFTSLSEIFTVPALTVNSPYLQPPFITDAAFANRDRYLLDSDYERIPQNILSLLQLGEPRFVVYVFGQSLTPDQVARRSEDFGMPINYRITAESVARVVMRVEFDPVSANPNDPAHEIKDYSKPRMVVERYSLLPAF